MKVDAVLINTARGGVVDEAAVAARAPQRQARRRGARRIRHEPLAAGSRRSSVCPNLILTPHIAGVTRESNVRVSSLIAEKVAAALTACALIEHRDAGRFRSRTLADLADARAHAGGRESGDGGAQRQPRLGRRGVAGNGVARNVARATVRAASANNGRADGNAMPVVLRSRGGAVLVDAQMGLAFPACALAVDEAIRARARIRRSVRRRHEQPSFRCRRLSFTPDRLGRTRRVWPLGNLGR
mgnify:CR=1 FL=1